jgi:hypothetical protein
MSGPEDEENADSSSIFGRMDRIFISRILGREEYVDDKIILENL